MKAIQLALDTADRGLDLTTDTIAQVIHECETCAAIKQAKRLKPLWYGGTAALCHPLWQSPRSAVLPAGAHWESSKQAVLRICSLQAGTGVAGSWQDVQLQGPSNSNVSR